MFPTMRQVSMTSKEARMMAAPFGVGAPRFLDIGYHPNFQMVGCLKKNPNLGPANSYTEKPRKHLPTYDWTRKLQLENFSRNLGYRVPHKLEEWREEAKGGGPGSCELPTFLELLYKRSPNVKRNVGFSLEKRFKDPPARRVTPGPGSYNFKDPGWIKHQWTPVNPFEWDGFVERVFKTSKTWQVAPNRYCYPDPNSITERIKRKVSERGPYDLFTGPRDESTIKNHFAPSTFKGAKTWLRVLPSELDRLQKNPQYGRWAPGNRMEAYPSLRMMQDSLTLCPKDPDAPGPADYQPIMTYEYRPRPGVTHPFGSSVPNARPGMKYKVHPGPGRYNIKDKRPHHGCRSSFLATAKRSEYLLPKQTTDFIMG